MVSHLIHRQGAETQDVRSSSKLERVFAANLLNESVTTDKNIEKKGAERQVLVRSMRLEKVLKIFKNGPNSPQKTPQTTLFWSTNGPKMALYVPR